ncbi:MAG: STAS domain-containing protein [Pseudomonadota bacterium]
MNLILNTEGPVDVVTVEEDRIDAAVAVDFKDAFRSLTTDREGAVVLDLNRVAFLDSSGLGSVVAVQKLLGEGRPLELAGLQPAVAKVMQLTRMHTVFSIHPTLSAALAAHGSAPAA